MKKRKAFSPAVAAAVVVAVVNTSENSVISDAGESRPQKKKNSTKIFLKRSFKKKI